VNYVSRQWAAPGIFNARSGIGGLWPVGVVVPELWMVVENHMALAFDRERMIRTNSEQLNAAEYPYWLGGLWISALRL
jgi:hypothetical protein